MQAETGIHCVPNPDESRDKWDDYMCGMTSPCVGGEKWQKEHLTFDTFPSPSDDVVNDLKSLLLIAEFALRASLA